MGKNIFRRGIQTILILFFQGFLLFISAWTLKWMWAWIFILLGVIILIINAIVIPREVIEERGKKKDNVKKWDKMLTTINIIPSLGIYIISGLDHRFHWTKDFLPVINIMGIGLVFLGSMLFTWSMISNKFFSTLVRIQDDRDHKIASGGPYKYVRHPGYAGFIIMSLATPVSLGSIYGLPMAFLVAVVFVIRTILEDKTLKTELIGYEEFSKKVKYRLIPFLW